MRKMAEWDGPRWMLRRLFFLTSKTGFERRPNLPEKIWANFTPDFIAVVNCLVCISGNPSIDKVCFIRLFSGLSGLGCIE
jgi:hypothetical protein